MGLPQAGAGGALPGLPGLSDMAWATRNAMSRHQEGILREKMVLVSADALARIVSALEFQTKTLKEAKYLPAHVCPVPVGGECGHETQATVSEWAESTFGPSGSNIRVAARANEEMAELLRHLSATDTSPLAAEEVADVVIVLYRLATLLNVNLVEMIDKKMAINRTREWKIEGGHGYHVRPTGLAGPRCGEDGCNSPAVNLFCPFHMSEYTQSVADDLAAAQKPTPPGPSERPSREAVAALIKAVGDMRQYCDETRCTHICDDEPPATDCGQCAINEALARCEAQIRGDK